MSMRPYSDDAKKSLRVELFKSSVLSTLYSLFTSRKKQAAKKGERYLLQDMADAMGSSKSQVSRWFNGDANPNWRLSTFYELCDALDGELRIEIVDRKTMEVHTPRGVQAPSLDEPFSEPFRRRLYIAHSSADVPVAVEEAWSYEAAGTAPSEPVYYSQGGVVGTAA